MRITGTHIYTMLRCEHAVTLDLHVDRSERRPITEVEEFVRQRGRLWEDEFVAGLGYPEPSFERGDFATGAAETERLMRQGAPGVSQGVLLGENRLGIPDLLRREPGASALGDFHYVVGDIKSSGRPRSDQVLQVAFYSRMLRLLQDRDPGYGFLILKDGREERFHLADFDAALDDVEERALAAMGDATRTTPFFSAACGKCHWSERCGEELRAQDDLSLVAGMTRGLRTTLLRIGCTTAAELCEIPVEGTARKTHLEPTLLRRMKKAAEARRESSPRWVAIRPRAELENAAILHHLFDPFRERMLFLGALSPNGAFHGECPRSQDEEAAAFARIIDALPVRASLVHYGMALPRWFAESTRDAEAKNRVEARWVDLSKRLRGAALYPSPVFGFADHVRLVLGLDPDREGEGDGAAMWAERPEGEAWLMQKGRSDLEDLRALLERLRQVEAE